MILKKLTFHLFILCATFNILKAQQNELMVAPRFEFKNLRKLSSYETYHFYTEQKVITNEYLLKNYIYEEPLEKVNWKLNKDTLNISGIHCQKATATFKGRNWIAWFAPTLPFEAGPWKLKTIKATKTDADKLRNAMYADPQGFLMAYLKSTGGILQDGGNAIQGLNFKNEVKNPIELK